MKSAPLPNILSSHCFEGHLRIVVDNATKVPQTRTCAQRTRMFLPMPCVVLLLFFVPNVKPEEADASAALVVSLLIVLSLRWWCSERRQHPLSHSDGMQVKLEDCFARLHAQ